MRRISQIIYFVLFLCQSGLWAQAPSWSYFADSISTYSSPHSHDINSDGVLDIIIGGGKDGYDSNSGIMAINGSNGQLLWKVPTRNEVFGSAVFQDVTNDGIKDVFITGREAQFYAIDGSDGSVIWDFYPYGTDPADSGWYNFYTPQFISDVDGDTFMDLLVTNGGDHSAPEWETNRPPGHIMVLSSQTGNILSNVVVPDSAETYCSPVVVDLQNNGDGWVLFGTGGENLGGSFYACPLDSIVNNNSNGAIALASDSQKGYIAPASVHFNDQTGANDFIFISFDGKVEKVNGADFSSLWTFQHTGTETSAAPVIGNFTGDLTPDVFLTLFKGVAPSFSDFYQVMLDGATGELKFIDSLGQLNYSSGNAVDINNDGRDEAIASISYNTGGYFEHRIEQIDFANNSISSLSIIEAGVNVASTPWIGDLDDDATLEMIYVFKKDSLNPGTNNGVYVKRVDLSSTLPNSGIAWGSYLGTSFDAHYSYFPVNCGDGSVVSAVNIVQPSCNNESDGAAFIIPSGSTGPNTYYWSSGSMVSFETNLSDGIYYARVTNSEGCFEDIEIELQDPYEITFGAITLPTCIGDINGSATLSSTGCPCMFHSCNFLWENGGINKTNDSLHSGWNQVMIEHPDGCIVVDSVLIPEPPPVIESFEVTDVFCHGDANGTIQLQMDSIYFPQSIEWFNGDTSLIIEGLSEGFYSVIASDLRGCVDSLNIEVNSPDSLIFVPDYSEYLCYGEQNGFVEFSVQGGTSPYIYLLNGEQYEDSVIFGLSEGIYSSSILDQNNCASQVDFEIQMLEPLELSFEVIPASGVGTLDGIIISNTTGGLPPYQYDWGGLPAESVVVYLPSGWYTLELTDSNGCTVIDSAFVGLLSLEEQEIKKNRVYPNPFANVVKFDSYAERVSVYSGDGRLILTQNGSDFVDLEHLKEGMYFIRLITEGKLEVFPVIRVSD